MSYPLLIAIQAFANEPAQQRDLFGTSMQGQRDLDGDARLDIVVGDPTFNGRGPDQGCFWVLSPARKRVLLRSEGPTSKSNYGMKLALIANRKAASYYVIASCHLIENAIVLTAVGADGRAEWTVDVDGGENWRLHELAAVTDLDGDGVEDFVVSTPMTRAGGSVQVRSGRTGQLLRTLTNPPDAQKTGLSVEALGIAEAAEKQWIACAYRRGSNKSYVGIFSLATGECTREIESRVGETDFGASLAFNSSLRLAGEPILAIGSPQSWDPELERERAIVVGLNTGKTLREQYYPERGARFGSSQALLRRADGSGAWIVGAPMSETWSGMAQYVLLTPDAKPTRIPGQKDEEKWAMHVFNYGDYDLDGQDDVAITFGNPENLQAMTVRVVSFSGGKELFSLSRKGIAEWQLLERHEGGAPEKEKH